MLNEYRLTTCASVIWKFNYCPIPAITCGLCSANLHEESQLSSVSLAWMNIHKSPSANHSVASCWKMHWEFTYYCDTCQKATTTTLQSDGFPGLLQRLMVCHKPRDSICLSVINHLKYSCWISLCCPEW